jgi:hypothetical protein
MFGVMDIIKLPVDDQFEIKLFFQMTQSSRDNQLQLDEFLGLISPSLQMQVNGHIYRKNIMANKVVCKFMNVNDDYIKPKSTNKMKYRQFLSDSLKVIKERSFDPVEAIPKEIDVSEETNDLFLSSFVSKLQTAMYVPENEILKQGDPPIGIFFVNSGDCIVNVRDQDSKDHDLIRLLVQGDHFGEISSIYRCLTTATVVSRNYNIMALISVDRLRELTVSFPNYLRLVK